MLIFGEVSKPFKVFASASLLQQHESLGQSWRGQEIQEQIDLCRHQTIDAVFKRLLPRQGLIVEAGCGLGRWVFHLRKSGFPVIGIEFSETAVRAASSFDDQGYVEQGDILNLRFADHECDAMISLGVVEHFEEGPQQALKEAWRVLRPGGLLLITVPTATLLRRIWVHPWMRLKGSIQRLRGRKLIFSEYRFTLTEIRNHLEQVGFRIEQIMPDELEIPRSIGLYIDLPLLSDKSRAWHLNALGLWIDRFLSRFGRAWYAGGMLLVCRKPGKP